VVAVHTTTRSSGKGYTAELSLRGFSDIHSGAGTAGERTVVLRYVGAYPAAHVA
jgi:hypothetical protein